MATVEGQIGVGVAREENGAEIDLESDGLYPTIHTDIPLRCSPNTIMRMHYVDTVYIRTGAYIYKC